MISYTLFAASASALEPGVFVSPGSPAGREYALPLPAARGQGAGKSVAPGGSGPLFGVGITPPKATAKATGITQAGANRSQRAARGHGRHLAATSSGASGSGGRNQVSPQELASLTHEGSVVPQVALWGGLVLLAGLAIGGLLAFLGRRRSS